MQIMINNVMGVESWHAKSDYVDASLFSQQKIIYNRTLYYVPYHIIASNDIFSTIAYLPTLEGVFL